MPNSQGWAHSRVSIVPLAFVAVCVCALLVAMGGVFASGAQAAAVGEFEARASSSVPLTSVVANPTTNLVYAQAYEGTSFFSYDPRTNVWTELAASPLNSGNNGGAAYLNGKIYTVYTGNAAHLGVYDIASGTWSEIANPLKEGTANIAAYGEDLYLVEGTNFVSYNPATETTTTLADAPDFAKMGVSECDTGFERWGGLQPYGGKLYGHQGNGCTGFADYDVASNTWTELPGVPEGTVAGSAIDPVSGTYFAYGNYSGKTLYSYDIATSSWSEITFPFSDINDGGMAYVSLPGLTGIYAIEGQENTGFTRYITAEAQADLSLTQSESATSATVGEQITYTIKVTNGGPNEATGVTVSDPLPANVSLVSAASTQGSCSGGSTVACSLGALANGGSATITVTVKATAAGTATNTASVSSEVTDPNSANNSATVTTTITSPRPSLLPARWLVPNGTLRVSRGSKWISDPLLNLNPSLTLSGTAQLVTYVRPPATGKPTVLATNSVYLAPGATKTLYLRLNRGALTKLRIKHRYVVQILLTLTDPFGRQVKATGVYLLRRAPAAKGKKG